VNLAEQLTRAFNAVTESSTRNTQHTLASLNDHIANLIRQVVELEAKQSKEVNGGKRDEA
jgi:polyhydroxyalkanoate synthesis regulator phasin